MIVDSPLRASFVDPQSASLFGYLNDNGSLLAYAPPSPRLQHPSDPLRPIQGLVHPGPYSTVSSVRSSPIGLPSAFRPRRRYHRIRRPAVRPSVPAFRITKGPKRKHPKIGLLRRVRERRRNRALGRGASSTKFLIAA
jgi:hypothetical protein